MKQDGTLSSWFRYFPDHYLWSQLMSSEMSLAAMGGANLQELDQIGRRLEGKVGDGEAWHEAWEWMADKVLGVAEQEWRAGPLHTAAGAFVRSAGYRYTRAASTGRASG